MTTVTYMLSSYDDFPIHQTSEPIAHPESGDPNHYDRYFFNGYSKDGSLFFALAMGLYPNRHVLDASFSVVRNGAQINAHASGRAPVDRIECTKIGPISIDVVVPMKEHRIVVDMPEQGLRADVTFHATSLPYEEPPFLVRAGNRTTMKYTRLTQLGHWKGWIEVDGNRHDITTDEFLGSRDRSWGIRGVGERAQMGAPSLVPPQFYWLWAPVCFDGFGTVFDVNEFSDGERWHQSGALLLGSDTIKHAHSVEYSYDWEPDTRRAKKFELTYSFADGNTRMIFEPLVHFQMVGLGYLSPDWGHGMWKGELATGGERFSVPVDHPMEMTNLHTQTLSRVTATDAAGTTHQGIGVLETLVLGPHLPSGFSGFDDGYRPQ